MTTTPHLGLANSTFIADVEANRPTAFPGEYNFALFYATDTNSLFIAPNPGTVSLGVKAAVSWFGIGGASAVFVPDATTYAVLAANTGRTHVMPNFTGNCTLTLPAAQNGLDFEFIGSAGAADAQSWIITSPAPLLKGGVLGMDTDAGAGSDELIPVYANGSSHVKITIATPDAGCRVRFHCDGTSWFISGVVSSAAAPVFA